jgi:hypothetical protein
MRCSHAADNDGGGRGKSCARGLLARHCPHGRGSNGVDLRRDFRQQARFHPRRESGAMHRGCLCRILLPPKQSRHRGPQEIQGKGGVRGLPYRPRGYHTN